MDNQVKRRLHLGIIYNFKPSWMGGVIYVMNIIKTLNFLEDNKKPEIFLFYNESLKEFIPEITYPYLKIIKWKFPSVVPGYIWSLVINRNLFVSGILKHYSLDVIYPLQDFPVRTKTPTKLITWRSDLQYKYYPAFFSPVQIFMRLVRTKIALRNADHLVVSSQAVLNDYINFFKIRQNLRIYVFHFVSVIENIDYVKKDRVDPKYGIPEDYYLVSNQFHNHKNHSLVLNALTYLKKLGIKVHIVMTGKLPNSSKSQYMNELNELISQNNLQDQISMLGVIPRIDQLVIMSNARAVIQPSLFEGWSTVIEDAKSLQVPVIASNIAVNIEQLGETGIYFDPHDPATLAKILSNFPKRSPNEPIYQEYGKRIASAAGVLIDIFSSNHS